MGLILSQKHGLELIENCDLPPPAKVFSGSEKTVLSPVNPVYSVIGEDYEDPDAELPRNSSGTDKLELLKALRLSQTRAREAEKKLDVLSKEKEAVLDFLLQESMHLFAYKQWVKLIEFQLCTLNNQHHQKEFNKAAAEAENGGDPAGPTIAWFMAVALCLGIASFGYAYCCGCMHPLEFS